VTGRRRGATPFDFNALYLRAGTLDEEAEIAVIGACLVRSDQMPEQVWALEELDFCSGRHQTIWAAILQCRQQDQPVDLITVKDRLTTLGKLKDIGGFDALCVVAEFGEAVVPSAASAHVRILRKHSAKRRAIRSLGDSIEKLETREDLDKVLAEQIASWEKLSGADSPAPIKPTYQLTEAPTEFPVDALPEPLESFCRELSTSLCCPTDMVAAAMLAASSAAIGNARAVRVTGDWTESAALYIAIVAHSGARKTPALGKPLKVLKDLQLHWRDEYDAAWLQYERELEEYNQWSGRRDLRPPKPAEPALRRAMVVDATVEALAAQLAIQPRGLLLFRDELTGWLKSFDAYRHGRGADREFYLSAWSQSYHAVNRRTGKPLDIRRPYLSILGAIPPSMLSFLGRQRNVEDGLIQRILFAFPDQTPVRFSTHAVPAAIERRYHELVKQLTQIEIGQDGPTVLTLSDAATELFGAYHDEIYQETEKPGFPPALAGAYSKFSGYLARLGLIVQLWKDRAATVVDWDSVERAWRLIQYFARQAQRVWGSLEQELPQTEEGRCQAAIARAFRRREYEASRRDIQRVVCNKLVPARTFTQTWKAMEVEGLIDEIGDQRFRYNNGQAG